MKVYLVREKSGINATAEYNLKTKEITVKKGSTLSECIAYTEKFRGSKSIEKSREGIVKNNTLQEDVKFKSASTAANFVTGSSTNGLIAWKDKQGRTIKEIVSEEGAEA